jgi:hypothetical protein
VTSDAMEYTTHTTVDHAMKDEERVERVLPFGDRRLGVCWVGLHYAGQDRWDIK